MAKQKHFYSWPSEKYSGGVFYSEYFDLFFEDPNEFYDYLFTDKTINELKSNISKRNHNINKIVQFSKWQMVKWPELEDTYFLGDLLCDHYVPELPEEAIELIEKLNIVLDKSQTNVYEPLDVRLEKVVDLEYLKVELAKLNIY